MYKQWVIPDIHGCAKTLQTLIEFQIKPSKHDWLYFLGDYIDRGPDSKGVIDFIIKLQDEEYNVRLLKGNHEELFIRAYEEESNRKSILGIKTRNSVKTEWKKLGGNKCLESFNIKNLCDFPANYIDWMKNLEIFIELDDYILVHAGLNFTIDDPFKDKNAMLWVREFKPDAKKINNKSVIHGHVPVSLELIYHLKENRSYKYIALDNGVYLKDMDGFGNLVAIELGSMELAIQYNVDW